MSRSQRQAAERLEDRSAAQATILDRWSGYVTSFVALNPRYAKVPVSELWPAIAAQWLETGRSLTTMEAVIATFGNAHLDPRDGDRVREASRRIRWTRGLSRAITEADRVFCRPNFDVTILDLLDVADPGGDEAERLAFFALMVVTGNRPSSVNRVRSVRSTRTTATVQWGSRKVRSNVTCVYRFSWTFTPREWIRRRWNSLSVRGWPFHRSANIASAVNQWLKRWNLAITASSAREWVDKILTALLDGGQLSGPVYENLIDHSQRVGLAHYRHNIQIEEEEG